MSGRAKYSFVLLALILFTCCMQAAEIQEQIRRLQAEAEQANGESLSAAISILDQATELATTHELWPMHLDLVVDKVGCARYWFDWTLVNQYLQEAERSLLDHKDSYSESEFEIVRFDLNMWFGDYYRNLGDFEQSKAYFEPMVAELKSRDTLPIDLYEAMMISLLHIGAIAKETGNLDEAIAVNHYVIDFERERAEQESRPAEVATTFSRLAELYALKGDYQTAELYYFKGAEYYEAIIKEDPGRKVRHRSHIIKQYLGAAENYTKLNQPEQAKQFFQKALDCHLPNDPEFAETYTKIGCFHMSFQEYDLAAQYLDRSAKSWQAHYGQKPFHARSKTYFAQAKLYQLIGDYERSATVLQQGIYNLLDVRPVPQFEFDPPLERISSKALLLEGLSLKTDLQYTMAKQADPLDRELWINCWNTSQLTFELLAQIRSSLIKESDKQSFVEKAYPVLEIALQAAYELGEDHHKLAWQCIERSKALLLLEGMRESRALAHSSIPAAELTQESSLKKTIFDLQSQLFSTKSKDSLKIKNRLFESNVQLEELHQKWNEEYPAFKASSEPFAETQLAAVQTLLTEKQTVIEYFLGKDHYFVFVLDKETGPSLHRYVLPTQLKQHAKEVKWDLYNKRDKAYQQKASYLYKHLLNMPNLPLLKEELIIVPDGILWHIPFDVLLTKEASFKDYSEAPFLLQEKAISYAFSMRWLGELSRRQKSTASEAVLCMAPSFTGRQRSALNAQQSTILPPLQYNLSEVSSIGKKIKAAVCVGANATKNFFQEQAGKYAIVHVASHAEINDRNPEHSYIAFTNEGQPDDLDNRLYVNELYRQKLSAEIVVLSACETGSGVVLQGEGVLSLSRAFAQAGVRSTMASLWKIDDASTQYLMQYFYDALADGQNRPQALRQAKLGYLSQADKMEAHPYYWAAFSLYGHTAPIDLIERPGGLLRFLIPGIGLLLLLLISFLGRKYFRRRLPASS